MCLWSDFCGKAPRLTILPGFYPEIEPALQGWRPMVAAGRRWIHGVAQALAASHNVQAVRSQLLDFLSNRRDLYKGNEQHPESPTRKWTSRDRHEAWNYRSAFSQRAAGRGLFH